MDLHFGKIMMLIMLKAPMAKTPMSTMCSGVVIVSVQVLDDLQLIYSEDPSSLRAAMRFKSDRQ